MSSMAPANEGRGLALPEVAERSLAGPAEESIFRDAFLRLLEHRAAIHTMGDSSSVPADVASDLFRSLCFVLGIDLEEGVVPERLLRLDLEHEFGRRLAELERKVKAAEQLWRDDCIAMPPIPNIALRDTLSEIGRFFRDYDLRSMAHEIPCSIDYPLCHPVDSSLLGVDYIAEYLRRLGIEARFLGRFDTASIERVLSKASPDHIGLLVNLYEPVATDVIGLALIGEDPARLTVGDAERAAITARLAQAGSLGRERVLRDAADAACDVLGVVDPDAKDYLVELVPELLPRIEVGLAHDSLRGVFAG